jgi:hypothetical protein
MQSWYSKDTDVEVIGSDKSDNESDEVIAEEINSVNGQLWQTDEQNLFPKSWFPYDTDV